MLLLFHVETAGRFQKSAYSVVGFPVVMLYGQFSADNEDFDFFQSSFLSDLEPVKEAGNNPVLRPGVAEAFHCLYGTQFHKGI